MNKETIIEALKNPLKIGDIHKNDLEKACSKYPYFQSAHSMYSKLLALKGIDDMGESVQKAAVYSNDRSQLYKLHHDNRWNKDAFDKQKKELIPIVETSNISYEASFQKLEKTLNDLNKEATNKELENESIPEIKGKEEKFTIREKTKKRAGTFDKNTSLKSSEKTSFNLDEHKEEKHSFGEWLGLISQKEKPLESDYQEAQLESEKDSEESIQFKLPEQENILSVIQSINKNANEPKPSNANEDFGIVTETLANILIKQGKLDKAIDVYTKLSLQNPEKSPYFDARIKALKKLL